VLSDERFDELGNLGLLAARQCGHRLESLANPPIGSGIPVANQASSQQALGGSLRCHGQRFDWIGRKRDGQRRTCISAWCFCPRNERPLISTVARAVGPLGTLARGPWALPKAGMNPGRWPSGTDPWWVPLRSHRNPCLRLQTRVSPPFTGTNGALHPAGGLRLRSERTGAMARQAHLAMGCPAFTVFRSDPCPPESRRFNQR
jgi:hypothetical protein